MRRMCIIPAMKKQAVSDNYSNAERNVTYLLLINV